MNREKDLMNARRANSMESGQTPILGLPFHRSAVVLLMLAICALPSIATTTCTTVTSTADDGSSGTLRYAIGQANAGACDTITFSLSYPATIALAQGQLEISNTSLPITITGPGAANLAISGNNATRVLQIDPGVTVSISSVTIRRGVISDFGGGVSNGGTATFTSSSFSGNSAGIGGGGFTNGGTATFINSTFSGNSARFAGGAIYGGGTITVINSTFSANSATGSGGGGIYNVGGTVTITSSTFFGNSASPNHGGGIGNAGGMLTVTNSTFSGNAGGDGGGIWNNQDATATVSNSTFSGNSGSPGANIQNTYGTLTIKNTLLASALSGGNCGAFGAFVSAGYNLADDSSCSSVFTATGDLNNTPAGLDPSGLKDNGGPTQTIAILPSSAAFNVIPLSPTNYCTDVAGNPVTSDQRGFSRPQVSACDIGAFEYSSDNDSGFANLTGGNNFVGSQTITGTVTATSFVGSGAGLTGVIASGLNCTGCVGNPQLNTSFTDGRYAQLGAANSFTNAQSISFNSVNAALTVRNSTATGVLAAGNDYGLYGSGAWGVYGSSTSSTGTGVQGVGAASGVSGLSNNGVGVYGVVSSTGIAGAFNATNGGKILSGQNNGTEVFSVANNGSVTIGGGTPIAKHLSALFSNVAFNTKMSPTTCTTWSGTVSGAVDGDTVAVGMGSSLMSANIVYSAWATSGGVTVRICNPTGAPTTVGSGNIRVDVWKH